VDDIPVVQRVGREADARYRAFGHPELDDGSEIPTEVAMTAAIDGRLWVAEVAGAVVGWVYVTRIDGEPCIGQISVSEAAGDQGIGSALLAHVVERARTAGEASIVLNTQAAVPWCAPWYARRGFVVVPQSAWSPALAAVAAAQTEGGLDWSTRVHMRLRLR
jgi:GNAT superfamily N-acetyltransferase